MGETYLVNCFDMLRLDLIMKVIVACASSNICNLLYWWCNCFDKSLIWDVSYVIDTRLGLAIY